MFNNSKYDMHSLIHKRNKIILSSNAIFNFMEWKNSRGPA